MPAIDNVDHFIVLMLENRSFDHMLGFLKREIPNLEGLSGQSNSGIVVSDDADYADNFTFPHSDPDHRWYSLMSAMIWMM